MNYYLIQFGTDKTLDIGAVVDRCIEYGLTTTEDGRTDVCSDYNVGPAHPGDDEGDEGTAIPDDGPTATSRVIEALSKAETGHIVFWLDGSTQLKVSYGRSRDPFSAVLTVGMYEDDLNPTLDSGDEQRKTTVQNRVDALVDLVCEISEAIEPRYGWSGLMSGYPSPSNPDDLPISEHIDRISWITVLSDPIIDDFGGRRHVLNAPAYRIEELDTGHVVLIKSDNPIASTETPSGSLDDFLLGEATEDG